MSDMMTFPNTVEEFMEQYKIVDDEKVYTNGADLVPIFRMMQWFEHVSATDKNVGTTISRQQAIDAVTDELDMIDHVPQWVFDRLEGRLKQLPPAQLGTNLAEVGTDTISRKQAIDALKEHRANYCDNTPSTFAKLSYAEKSRVDELDTAIATLVNLPPAQPEPCEDAVSRKAAIDGLNDAVHEHNITDFDAVATILALPPVTPKQRTGKWIKITNTLYKCDRCGAVQLKGNYCKNCGAKMEGTNNETD